VSVFKILFLLLLVAISLNAPGAGLESIEGDDILGDWVDKKNEVQVHCYKVGEHYFGKTTWVKNLEHSGQPLPKEEQHWVNMVVMKNFRFKNEEWFNGTIYHPRNNQTYKAFITMKNKNEIEVTGYIWFRFLSKSETFIRVKK